jgi:pyrroline-5-carboxylate reductase
MAVTTVSGSGPAFLYEMAGVWIRTAQALGKFF